MFENDYIMRMILQLVSVIQRSLLLRDLSPEVEAKDIEDAVGNAIDIDARLFFSLAPESMVSMLQLGSFDEQLSGYVLRSMYYEADILEKAGDIQRASLRRSQADAIAKAYGADVTPADATPAALEAFFNKGQEDPLP